MAAVAGVLGQELAGAPKWYMAGAQHYWLDYAPLLAIQFLVLGFLELKRFQGWKQTGTSGVSRGRLGAAVGLAGRFVGRWALGARSGPANPAL
jgi:hypothetical protein